MPKQERTELDEISLKLDIVISRLESLLESQIPTPETEHEKMLRCNHVFGSEYRNDPYSDWKKQCVICGVVSGV